MKKIVSAATSALVLAAAAPIAADAAIVVNITQSATGVTATATGTLNLLNLTVVGPSSSLAGLRGQTGYVGVGTDGTATTAYSGFSGPANIGTSSAFAFADSSSGSAFALNSRLAPGAVPVVFVSSAFTNGTVTSGTAFFSNATIASLNLTAGQYVFTSPGDTVTINIGAPVVPSVPEPATWGLMLAGFGLVGAGLRTRRRSIIVTYA